MTRIYVTIIVLTALLTGFGPTAAYCQDRKKIYLSIFPAGSDLTSSSSLIITATTASFYIGKKSPKPSTISAAPYFPLPSHVGLGLRSNLLLEKYRTPGDIRILYYPQYTWGLPGNPESGNRLLINYKYVRIYETLLREITPALFAGLGYQLDAHMDMDLNKKDSLSQLKSFTHYPYGTGLTEHSVSSGITFNVLYDSRLQTGNYFNGVYRINPIFLGSNTTWHSLYLDFRKYIRLSDRPDNLLTFWTFLWSVLDSHAPFLDLPSTGWDPYQQRSARGFPQNRFRGNSLLYGESEFRSPYYADGHLGFVAFINLNSINEPGSRQFSYFHPAAGGGIRLKFSKLSTAKIALDCAVSDGYVGVYLNLGDTF